MSVDLPQSEFFREVSSWFVQHVLSAWRERPELQGVIGSYATMAYGEDVEQARTNVVVDACRADLRHLGVPDAGAREDRGWEWRHWSQAMSLAKATPEQVDAALMLGALTSAPSGRRHGHSARALDPVPAATAAPAAPVAQLR